MKKPTKTAAKADPSVTGKPEALDKATDTVIALPGQGNPALGVDEATGEIEAIGGDGSVPALDENTQTVTALPGQGNPAIANPEADSVDEPGKAKRHAGKHAIKLSGKGTQPFYTNGAMRRVDRGEVVHVTDAELKSLKDSGVEFTKA